MKAILVIDDMPKSCDGCPLHHSVFDEVLSEWFVNCQLDTFIDEDGKRPSQCPLKPMPDIKTEEAIKLANMINPKATFQEFADGWNACIDKIMGETE